MKTVRCLALLVLWAAAPGVSLGAPPDADRWNLKDLYATQADWDQDALKLGQQLPRLSQCSGHMGQSVQGFKACMDLNAELLKRSIRLSAYASQLNDEDTGLAAGQDLKQRAQVLNSRLDEASSFLSPEILKLGRSRVDALLRQDRSLAIYRHPLDDMH
jgi:oligoendopeptidase F